jgi:KDO2-lipid IV(A) lauroyltransferase
MLKDILEFILIYAVKYVIKLLPWKLKLKVGALVGRIAYLFDKRHRIVAVDNLKKVGLNLKDGSKRVARIYSLLGKEAVEFLSLEELAKRRDQFIEKYIKIEGEEYLRIRRNKGLINVVGHIGNWELIPLIYSYLGYKTIAVAYPQHNKLVNKFINKLRVIGGVEIVPRKEALTRLKEGLKEGKIIGIFADQYLKKNGVRINFLGKEIEAPIVPALLAIRYKIPLIVSVILREDELYHRLIIHPPIEPPLSSIAPLSTRIKDLTQRWNDILVYYIQLYPEQWFGWLHRRFR